MSGQLEYRSREHGVEVVDVSFPERMIEVVVMPYEHPTTINEPGRTYEEVVSRGAFDGIESKNGGRIKVNRDHDTARTIGRVVALHPSREVGLVAELKISDTELGKDSLTLASDGLLDASAGFMLLRQNGKTGPVVPGAEVWETRSRRRLNKLYLAHVALTPEPAYEAAQVLAVRAQAHTEPQTTGSVATPNRDRILFEQQRQLHADINRRYLVS